MASFYQPDFSLEISTAYGKLKCSNSDWKIVTGLTYTDSYDSLAKEADITFVNKVFIGKRKVSNIIKYMDKVRIYANTGGGRFLVFYGVVWAKDSDSDNSKTVTIKAYDMLIWCMKSEDIFYFKKGLSTKEIIKRICSQWGLRLSYSYGSIKHSRLKPVQHSIGDMIVTTLNEAQTRIRKRYIIANEGTTIIIKYAGTNKKIYQLNETKNVISTSSQGTLDETITKIKIYGQGKEVSSNKKKKSRKSDKVPLLATMTKNTKKYGTLQTVMQKEEKESLSKQKKKAKNELNDKANPMYTNTVTAVSNPHIRRGDYVDLQAHPFKGRYMVKSVSHDCMAKTMDIELY